MDELYQRLTAYQTAMCLARNMLRQGIISEDDYRKIDTIIAKMLMYGKEASNRKQEIDRQHYTIPNQRPKDKHCGKI